MTDRRRLRREAVDAPNSGIISVITYAREREGIIPLWAGEGDLATPAFITDASADSLAAGETFYTYQAGLPRLRQAIADYTSRLYGREYGAERFTVTGSGMHAIHLTISALAGNGDEVIYFGPAWPNFAAAAGIAGAKPREVLLQPREKGWHLNLAAVEAAIGPATKAVFVNSPANPTGWTADEETLRSLLSLARDHGLTIIADEIYNRFFYDSDRAPSFHDVMQDDDPIFFVNSFSKNWAMTGWRVGWIETSPAHGRMLENLVQYSTTGVAPFIQRGAIAAIEQGENFVKMQIERAQRARQIFADRLLATNRVSMTPPAGAFYAFFAIDGVDDTKEAVFRIVDEAGVGLSPGTAFGDGGKRFMRACFHRRLDHVEEAAERLARWIGQKG